MIIPFPQKQEVTIDDAWQTYVRLAAKAQETSRFEDGIAAGRAWGRFLARFTADGTEAPR
jgi:hypothetical protein